MKFSSPLRFSLAVAACAAACAPPVPVTITLFKMGETCAADDECGTRFCRPKDHVCTRKCARQDDCFAGFDCGYAFEEDAARGGLGPTCYRSRVVVPSDPKGGYGASCATYSPDPDSGVACSDEAKNPCAEGFSCLSRIKCDPDAYCTAECEQDDQCPPSFYCGLDTGYSCEGDSECTLDRKCQTVAGVTGKLCVGKRLCRRREQCSPCGNSDQCPGGYVCAVQDTGERYCGKLCGSDEHCPQAFEGEPFYSCVDAGNGQDSVCRPRQGACHGPSSIEGVEPGGVCASCRPGQPADCPEGFCVLFNTQERFCSPRCTLRATRGANGRYTTAANPRACPEDANCRVYLVPEDCGAACDAPGYCQRDVSGRTATCWPN